LDKAAIISGEIALQKFNGRQGPDPWRLCSVTQVEEIKLLIRMLPIWFTNLMFSAVFAQVGTLFLSQGTTMDRHVTPNFQIPAASFPLFITATICALLPLYDKFLVPFMRKFTGNKRGMTLLQRIGVGQVICTLSITVAAVVEQKRMRAAKDSPTTTTVPMSIFWLLPQYMLIGASEVFISVGQMEFFYDQAPDSMRSVGAALYLSTVAVGSFISSLLVTIVTKLTWNSNGGWIGNDLKRCHIDYFYWLLAGLSTLNLFLYVASAKWYRYKQVPGPVLDASSCSSPEQKYCVEPDAKTVDNSHNGTVKASIPYDLSPLSPSS
jgi:peptide/histidine transporter 3/4